ncbi:MAG: hypothetical protein FJ109_06120 [Deltaproteobacteria bacterium]|nr:hypothetical protein [Deltaproteobacteria bacterium]
MRNVWVPLLLCLTACSEEKGPEEVVRTAYQLAEYARQNEFGSVQGEFFALLSEQSQKDLAACGQSVAGSPAGGQATAGASEAGASCLVFAGFEGAKGDLALERVASGPSRVRMQVASNGKTRFVELVREDGWRIDLVATTELNRGHAAR